MEFPFDDAPNTMAIICSHVFEQGDNILYVSHDEDDGMWQFWCGKSHEMDDAKVVFPRGFLCPREKRSQT